MCVFRKKMQWLKDPLPVAALRDLVDAYVPKFQNHQFASRPTQRPVCSIEALSDITVVWCEEGGALFGWYIPTDKHWLVGQLLDSHVKCLVRLSRTQFVAMTPRSTLQEWDISSCEHRWLGNRRYMEVNGSPRLLALLSNGELAISDCDGSIGVWNRHERTHRNLVPSPNAWREFWCSFIWNPPISHHDQWTCLLALPDGRLAAGSAKGMVCIFDADSGTCLQTCCQKQKIFFMSWRASTESLLISKLWGTAEWNLSQAKATPHKSTDNLVPSPHKGPCYLVSLEDGSVVLFDLSHGGISGFASLGGCRFVVAVNNGIVAME